MGKGTAHIAGDCVPLLRDIDLFAAFDDDALAALAASVEQVAIPGGDVLITQGEPADCAYVVHSGRLRVTVERGDGTVHVLGEIGRGDVVGEMALLTDDNRSATVTAVRDTRVIRLPGDALAALFAHPQALRAVVTQVVRRMQRAIQAAPGRTPIATLALVPLSDAPEVTSAIEAIATALEERTATFTVVRGADADPTPSWAERVEAEHDLVAYCADPEPTDWTSRCLRHADQVLLVAAATDRPDLRPVEALVEERRRTVAARTGLLLVHPPTSVDPSGTSRWLARRSVDAHLHLRLGVAADAGRVARHLLDRPVVLVLSGGGARGMAEIGVLRALEELGVPVDAVGGTSAGALVAGAVARAWDHRRIHVEMRAGLVGFKPLDLTLPAVALASGRRVTEHLQAHAGELDIEDLWLPFFCVSTNLSRVQPHVHDRGPAWRAVRASFAIPGVFPPVPEHGDVLVDGGLVDNLPVGCARARHSGAIVIGVDVGTRRDLPAGSLPPGGIVQGSSVLWDQINPRRRRDATLTIVRLLARLTELGSQPDADRGDVVVRPAVQDLPMLDFDRFDELVARGYRAGRDVLEPWVEARAGVPF